jgi:hypothetical protein
MLPYGIKKAVRVGIISAAIALGGLFTFAMLYLYQEAHRPLPPSPPFPSKINNIPVVWVPDENIRKLARGVHVEDVAWMRLEGGGFTGVPNGEFTITNRKIIALFLKGTATAVRRETPAPDIQEMMKEKMGTSPPFPVDHLFIGIKQPKSGSIREVSFDFMADSYEGELMRMLEGTVSPKFQDALRACGILPRPTRNVVEYYLNKRQVERLTQ